MSILRRLSALDASRAVVATVSSIYTMRVADDYRLPRFMVRSSASGTVSAAAIPCKIPNPAGLHEDDFRRARVAAQPHEGC
jgi:hypothetical protein